MSALIKGSLGSVAKRNNQSIAQSFLDCEMLVLMDVSSSMRAHDAPGNQSRYKAGCNELARLQVANPGKIGVIAWASGVQFCPSGVPEDLGGTTNLTKALQFVRHADGLGIQIVIISDGEPDDTVEPLALARNFQTKLHCVFVGPEGSAGEKFLRLLAQTSGGQYVRQSTSELDKLSLPLERLLLAA